MNTLIVPANFPDNLEKQATEEKCSVVGIDEMSITYIQPADTNSSADEVQTITLTTRCGCCFDDTEEGFYFDITIPEGQHWSVDGGDSLKALVDDFKKRIYMTTCNGVVKQEKTGLKQKTTDSDRI